MRALLKTGQWVDIDTNYLFDNQYNTTEAYGNKRIFDGDIKKIEDDVRLGLGKCKYCGAIVKRGEEEKHFLEKESKSCDGCFWYRDKVVSKKEPVIEKEEAIEDLPDGTQKRVCRKLVTTTEVFEKACTYGDNDYGNKTDCTNKECRTYGIKWFTPDNCYFLRYPNGTEDYTIGDWLKNSWNKPFGDRTNYRFNGLIGSYTLDLSLHDDEKTIYRFTLHNARKQITFTYDLESDIYSIYDGIHNSPTMRKHILSMNQHSPKVNEKVNDMLKKIMIDVYSKIERVGKAS